MLQIHTAALAFVVAAFIASATTDMPAGWHILATLAWVALGVALHFSARAVLGRLR